MITFWGDFYSYILLAFEYWYTKANLPDFSFSKSTKRHLDGEQSKPPKEKMSSGWLRQFLQIEYHQEASNIFILNNISHGFRELPWSLKRRLATCISPPPTHNHPPAQPPLNDNRPSLKSNEHLIRWQVKAGARKSKFSLFRYINKNGLEENSKLLLGF